MSVIYSKPLFLGQLKNVMLSQLGPRPLHPYMLHIHFWKPHDFLFIYALPPFSPCKLLTKKYIYLDLATFWDEINFRLLYGCFIFLSSWATSLVFSYPVWPWMANLIFVNNARLCFFQYLFHPVYLPWCPVIMFGFGVQTWIHICFHNCRWYLCCWFQLIFVLH